MNRLSLARALFVLAAVSAVLAIWAFFTGGFRVYVLGVPLSARGADRAMFVALLAFVVGVFLHEPLRRRAHRVMAVSRGPLGFVTGTAARVRWLPTLVVLAAILVFWAGTRFGTRATGGADQYGYMSQAALWLKGDLRIRQDFVRSIPWPNAEWSFAPLGYKPAENHTIVPTYPPGLPLLMALASLIGGSGGPYYIPWISGAALVVFTYLLGLRLTGPVVGATAALAIAVTPIVLMMTFSMMSDVPVAACWTAALLLAAYRTGIGAAGAGFMTGLAVLIRPNLVPLAVIPFAVVAWRVPPDRLRRQIVRAMNFTLAFVPFPLFIAWLFNELYGSPVRSGYGDNAGLFSLQFVPVNLARYPQWIWESQGPAAFAFLVAPLLLVRAGPQRLLRAAFLAFIALLLAAYLVYLPFEAWWYTRFLLPAYPLMFLLGADAVWSLTARFGSSAQTAAAWLFALVLIFPAAKHSSEWRVHDVGRGEQKYEDVGRFIAIALPPNAVVYSMQHSGTIRYYAGRLTIRWDYLEPEWLDRSIEHMREAGYEPFIVLDNWEVPLVRERFASQQHVRTLALEPREAPCTGNTYLYRLFPKAGQPARERIPQLRGCE